MGKKLKSYRANEDELRRRIIKKFVGLRPNSYLVIKKTIMMNVKSQM